MDLLAGTYILAGIVLIIYQAVLITMSSES